MTNAPSSPQYIYRATVTRVIDGDTVEVVVDLGFRITRTVRIRLLGYDAPELFSGDRKDEGQQWKEAMTDILSDPRVIIRTKKDTTTYDRYLADMWIEQTGLSVSELITSRFSEGGPYGNR